MKTTIFLIMVLLINNSCSAQNNIDFYYQNKTQATKTDSIGYKFYLENTSKEFLKKDNEVLLFFNNAAFIDDIITINGKKYNFDNYTCGYREIKISKGNRKIKIMSKKKEKMEFNLKKGIDYIIINGNFDNKWSVTFSEYFPIMECL
ncbi:hypothetical protein C1631_012025 [Chryseobacterium phosphatilyticum]|uniref:Uncharacterized protein n=1 Tax=Chryseobacterium phosphatilyticum TaxID=475075 RepID=A0A316XA39_9FLAO|nr:hypothetical protein [Chryseobacterium phosphatilyticum]PWN70675.1 hypothetical protein C1631_012025 [Chryseobacterium phosphatilyticum]